MKIFLLSQSVNNGYDTYDSLVVCAESEKEAQMILPHGKKFGDVWSGWAYSPEQVKVEYIGEAKDGLKAGVILESFNAG